MGLPYFVALLGEACAAAGDVEGGRQHLEEALTTADRTGAYFGYSEMLRLKGELLLLGGRADAEAAATCFRAALDSARSQGARLPELRAALSLAGLWSRQGRLEAGKSLVRPIYDGLSEGHETADLRQAAIFLQKKSVPA